MVFRAELSLSVASCRVEVRDGDTERPGEGDEGCQVRSVGARLDAGDGLVVEARLFGEVLFGQSVLDSETADGGAEISHGVQV